MLPHEILEELANRGYCPVLLYDDNGKWLVCDSGMQPSSGGAGEYATFISTNDVWFDNITDAVNYYLKETEENIEQNKE